MTNTDMSLRDAAQAVIDRWETPLWKDAPATAVFIADLRQALARDAGRASLQSPGFSAEDMATASAQGFRDGAASLAAAEAIPKALPTGWSLADHGDEISLEGPSGERWRYRAASGTGTDSDFIYRFLHASLSANAGEPPRDGWLHENGLLYRLTDERHPCNRDEINVTMADGSRSIEARSRCALELLDRIRAAPPTAQAEGWTKLPGQLPEPGMPVLLDIGKKYPIRAMWAAKHTVQAADDDTDWGEYVEEDDMYYAPEGWYEWNQCEDNHWRVTETPRAWMPLPPTSAEGVEP